MAGVERSSRWLVRLPAVEVDGPCACVNKVNLAAAPAANRKRAGHDDGRQWFALMP